MSTWQGNAAVDDSGLRQIEVQRLNPVGGGVFIILFGVLLPLASIVVEVFWRECTRTLFDPIPTPLHTAIALAVPLGNLLVWWVTRSGVTPRFPAFWGLVNGMAIGAGTLYSIIFGPFIPAAIIGVLFFGLGLLPLGPLFGFIAALMCRARLTRGRSSGSGQPRRVRGLVSGFLVAAGLLTFSFLNAHLHNRWMAMAGDESNPAAAAKGVQRLRQWGSEDRMLRECYWETRSRSSPLNFFADRRWSDVDACRQTFYRVTGTRYDEHPMPVGNRAGLLQDDWWGARDEDWDTDWDMRGGEEVGGILRGLSMAASRIDGSVNADAATAYFEWVIEFKNTQTFQQEARCRIALPPDGVVSRLTLWINGEEREAAFGGRAQVRAAYEKVVKVERRDPVLVTTAGPDRVQMQCFPVPAGGTMKVRVGITAPLQLDSLASGIVRLPHFASRNFSIPEAATHAVWIESRTPVSANQLAYVPATAPAGDSSTKPEPGSLRGGIGDAALKAGVAVNVPRPNPVLAVSFDDPYDKSVGAVVQRIEAHVESAPDHVVLAIEGSRVMADALPAVADALASFPAKTSVTAMLALDGVAEITGDAATVAAKLRSVKCVGGQDSVPAMTRAWDLASQKPNSVILWVHGPQPTLSPADPLRQRMDFTRSGPRILHLSAVPGTNDVLEQIAEFARLEVVPNSGNVRNDLTSQFAGWANGVQKWRFARSAGPSTDGSIAGGDIQIVRLWAKDRVLEMLSERSLGKSPDSRAATALAVQHHLVTPVSGAVVLETQQQYDDAGLSPVQAIPLPPAVWAALLMLPVVWWLARKRASAA